MLGTKWIPGYIIYIDAIISNFAANIVLEWDFCCFKFPLKPETIVPDKSTRNERMFGMFMEMNVCLGCLSYHNDQSVIFLGSDDFRDLEWFWLFYWMQWI